MSRGSTASRARLDRSTAATPGRVAGCVLLLAGGLVASAACRRGSDPKSSSAQTASDLSSAAVELEPPALEAGDSRLGEGLADAIAAALGDVRAAPGDPAPRFVLAQLYESNALLDLARVTYSQARVLAPEDARAAYHEARMLRELGDFDAARAALEVALELAPDYGPAWRLSGEWSMEGGDFSAAERAFTRAAQLMPELPDGQLGLAKAALARGDPAAAESWARQVLAAHPEERYGQYLLGSALRELGRLDEASRALARSEGWVPSWSDPWLDEAQSFVSGYNLRMREAKALLEAGRPDLSVERLVAIIADYPDDVTVQGMLTAALVGLERFDEAESMLAAARTRQPQHYRIALNQAIVRWKRGALDEALVELDRALALHPDHATALYVRAQVLAARRQPGDLAGAVAAYRAALVAGAEPRKLLPRLGQLEVALERYADAAETYAAAARELPDSASIQAYLSGARAEIGDFAGAREALLRARLLDPDHKLLATLELHIAQLEAAAAESSER